MGNDLTARPLVVALLVVTAAASLGAEKEHVAERFDVIATVQADGSLEVEETIVFRFTGGEFTKVTRELTARETDGVEVIQARMNGTALPHGESPGHVEIEPRRSGTRIVWHFAPARDVTHSFSLRYRYAGVVRHGDGEDWFRWPPYPTRFDYPIESGSVRLTWPMTARIRRVPDVQGAAASTSPIDNGILVAVANYRSRDEDVLVTARFEPGAFPGAEPQWQRDARRADRLAPAFFAGALMIGAATVLALWLFFLRYKREQPEAPLPSGSVTGPPEDLPPSLAGAIVNGRVSIGGPQLVAAAFELARRDVLQIEERAGSGLFKKREFVFVRGREDALRPHEGAVFDALFKDGQHEAPFRKALQRLNSRASKVRKVMNAELAEAGFIDRDRREGGRALIVSGFVVVGLATLLAMAATMLWAHLGGAVMLLPIALSISALAMLISGTAFSTLTPSGAAAARRWEAYRRHLKSETKQGRVPADGQEIGRLLPYAAALGVLTAFGKALGKTQVRNLPPWLRTLDSAGAHAAMLAVIASASSTAAHGGGAAGAGGAGGVGAGGSSSAR